MEKPKLNLWCTVSILGGVALGAFLTLACGGSFHMSLGGLVACLLVSVVLDLISYHGRRLDYLEARR